MKKLGITSLVVCVFALCLALAGCGGGAASGGDAADAKAAFAGTWDLVEMTQNGQQTDSDNIEKLKALGLEVYLNLNEDGTSELVLFADSSEGTWEASSATVATLSLQGESVEMKLEGGKLRMEQEGSSLTFQKGEPRGAASTEAASSGAAASDEAASSDAAASGDAADAADASSDEAASSAASEG